MAKSLGEDLRAALSNITTLIIKTDNQSERTQLTQQQAKIAGQPQVFVDQAVDAANTEAETAKKKLDKVASSIKKFATAIDKLESLAEKVG